MAPRSNSQPVEVSINQFLERVERANNLHPEADEKMLLYRTYAIAHAYRPEKFSACFLCLKNKPKSPPKYLKDSEMARHCRLQHPHAEFVCDYSNCSVRFTCAEEKEAHHLYAHIKDYGWWIPAR